MSVSFLPLQLGGKSVQISCWLLLPHTAEDENSEDPGQCEYRTEEGMKKSPCREALKERSAETEDNEG